jgi:DNA-binding transcriptional ArsR family regulator
MNAISITHIANLVGDSARIQMLTALLDGRSHSASELALAASVSAQTASSHLSKLSTGGLIVSEQKGRQRLFRLNGTDVAVAVESLGALAQANETTAMPELRFARSCYDHLAGALAIALRDQLLKKGILRHKVDAFALTASGEQFLRTLEIEAEPLRELRRSFARKCLDWTERHHHIGGAVGAALLGHFLETKWLVRIRDTRALRLTHEGAAGFEQVFGVRCAGIR